MQADFSGYQVDFLLTVAMSVVLLLSVLIWLRFQDSIDDRKSGWLTKIDFESRKKQYFFMVVVIVLFSFYLASNWACQSDLACNSGGEYDSLYENVDHVAHALQEMQFNYSINQGLEEGLVLEFRNHDVISRNDFLEKANRQIFYSLPSDQQIPSDSFSFSCEGPICSESLTVTDDELRYNHNRDVNVFTTLCVNKNRSVNPRYCISVSDEPALATTACIQKCGLTKGNYVVS